MQKLRQTGGSSVSKWSGSKYKSMVGKLLTVSIVLPVVNQPGVCQSSNSQPVLSRLEFHQAPAFLFVPSDSGLPSLLRGLPETAHQSHTSVPSCWRISWWGWSRVSGRMSLFLKNEYVEELRTWRRRHSNSKSSLYLRFLLFVHFAAERHSAMRSICADGMLCCCRWCWGSSFWNDFILSFDYFSSFNSTLLLAKRCAFDLVSDGFGPAECFNFSPLFRLHRYPNTLKHPVQGFPQASNQGGVFQWLWGGFIN